MKTAATVILAALAVVAAGCGGSKNATPAASTQAPATTEATTPGEAQPLGACQAAPAGLMRRIETHVVLEGSTLTHPQVVSAQAFPGYYFVTARVDGGGAHNELATWATERLGPKGPVYAVDSWAALISTWVAAGLKHPDLSIHDAGAYKSRVCVAGPGAPRGQEAPLSGRPASGK